MVTLGLEANTDRVRSFQSEVMGDFFFFFLQTMGVTRRDGWGGPAGVMGLFIPLNRNKGSSGGDCVELYGGNVTSLQGCSLYSLYSSFKSASL